MTLAADIVAAILSGSLALVADAWMNAQGIVRPERVVAMLAPRLGELPTPAAT